MKATVAFDLFKIRAVSTSHQNEAPAEDPRETAWTQANDALGGGA